MFYASPNNMQSGPDSFTMRMRGYGANAGQMVAQGAQTAAAGIGKGVKQGVYVTRVWAAPRLENVADYTTATVAPKVSTALRDAANQVRPADLTQKKSRSALTWSLFATGVVAIAGAVTAMVRYKYRTATVADADDFDTAGSGKTTTDPADASAESTTASTDTGANGRVSASGW